MQRVLRLQSLQMSHTEPEEMAMSNITIMCSTFSIIC